MNSANQTVGTLSVLDEEETELEHKMPRTRRARALILGTLVLLLIGVGITGYLVSREPDLFDPREVAMAAAGESAEALPPGAVLTATVVRIANTLLDKNGGFLSNDVMPPFMLLDNMPSWETGVLTELRDTVRAMRNDFARAQSQSAEVPELMRADAQFHFAHDSWMLPASEDEYRRGIEALNNYLARLTDGDPGSEQFYARADNLIFYLATVEKRLGNLSQRLSASTPLAGSISQRTQSDGELLVPGGDLIAPGTVSWLEADNVFYEARGYIWALLHTLRALEQDFEPLLASKQATVPLHEIILKLEFAQQAIWSPVILNNSGFGLLTNHSLILASYISRSNAAIIDLRKLLSEG